MPRALPLYEAFAGKVRSEFGDVSVKVQKTQIAFSNKRNFAFAWLPIRSIKGRPEVYIIVSFGLGHRLEDKRIEEAAQPCQNRWTHHVIIRSESDIDEQLMGWIRQAYAFSLAK